MKALAEICKTNTRKHNFLDHGSQDFSKKENAIDWSLETRGIRRVTNLVAKIFVDEVAMFTAKFDTRCSKSLKN
jgi:hypothetical protein